MLPCITFGSRTTLRRAYGLPEEVSLAFELSCNARRTLNLCLYPSALRRLLYTLLLSDVCNLPRGKRIEGKRCKSSQSSYQSNCIRANAYCACGSDNSPTTAVSTYCACSNSGVCRGRARGSKSSVKYFLSWL